MERTWVWEFGTQVASVVGMPFLLSQRFRAMPLLLAAALSFAPSCFGAVSDGYVDVAYAPPSYATYPSYVYDGVTVYYIDGRWYRHHNGHWGYYRTEPSELYRYRTRHMNVYRAPPAHRGHVYRAPPRHDDHHRRAQRDDRHHYSAPPRDGHHDKAPPRDRRGHHRD